MTTGCRSADRRKARRRGGGIRMERAWPQGCRTSAWTWAGQAPLNSGRLEQPLLYTQRSSPAACETQQRPSGTGPGLELCPKQDSLKKQHFNRMILGLWPSFNHTPFSAKMLSSLHPVTVGILLLACGQTAPRPVVGMRKVGYARSKAEGIQSGASPLPSSFPSGTYFMPLALHLGHDFLLLGTRPPPTRFQEPSFLPSPLAKISQGILS